MFPATVAGHIGMRNFRMFTQKVFQGKAGEFIGDVNANFPFLESAQRERKAAFFFASRRLPGVGTGHWRVATASGFAPEDESRPQQ